MKVIGVLDSNLSMLFFSYVGPPTVTEVMGDSSSSATSYFIDLADGADAGAIASNIERVLLPYGAQGVDIEQEMEESQAQQQTFM
jgi:hypothetical protein